MGPLVQNVSTGLIEVQFSVDYIKKKYIIDRKNRWKKWYATQGLKLAIEKCKKIILEDEIYLSVYKNNEASLKVQLKCGAYKVGETKEDYLMRIKIDKK